MPPKAKGKQRVHFSPYSRSSSSESKSLSEDSDTASSLQPTQRASSSRRTVPPTYDSSSEDESASSESGGDSDEENGSSENESGSLEEVDLDALEREKEIAEDGTEDVQGLAQMLEEGEENLIEDQSNERRNTTYFPGASTSSSSSGSSSSFSLPPHTFPHQDPVRPPSTPKYNHAARMRSLFRSLPTIAFFGSNDPKANSIRLKFLREAKEEALRLNLSPEEAVVYIKNKADYKGNGKDLQVTGRELEELKIRAEGQKLRTELKAQRRARVDGLLGGGGVSEKGKGKAKEADPLPNEVNDPPDLSTRPLLQQNNTSFVDFNPHELFHDFNFDGVARLHAEYIDAAEDRISNGLEPERVELDPEFVAQCVLYNGYELSDTSHTNPSKPADNCRTSKAIRANMDSFGRNGVAKVTATDIWKDCAGHNLIDTNRLKQNEEPKKKSMPTVAAIEAQHALDSVYYETLQKRYNTHRKHVILTGAVPQLAYGSTHQLGRLSAEPISLIAPFSEPLIAHNMRHPAFTATTDSTLFASLMLDQALIQEEILLSSSESSTSLSSSSPLHFSRLQAIFESLAQSNGRPATGDRCDSFDQAFSPYKSQTSPSAIRKRILLKHSKVEDWKLPGRSNEGYDSQALPKWSSAEKRRIKEGKGPFKLKELPLPIRNELAAHPSGLFRNITDDTSEIAYTNSRKITQNRSLLFVLNSLRSIKSNASRTAEQRSDISRRANAKLTKEQKKASHKKRNETMGVEGRRRAALKREKRKGAARRSEIAQKTADTRGKEGYAASSKKTVATRGHEGYVAGGLKGGKTRARNRSAKEMAQLAEEEDLSGEELKERFDEMMETCKICGTKETCQFRGSYNDRRCDKCYTWRRRYGRDRPSGMVSRKNRKRKSSSRKKASETFRQDEENLAGFVVDDDEDELDSGDEASPEDASSEEEQPRKRKRRQSTAQLKKRKLNHSPPSAPLASTSTGYSRPKATKRKLPRILDSSDNEEELDSGIGTSTTRARPFTTSLSSAKYDLDSFTSMLEAQSSHKVSPFAADPSIVPPPLPLFWHDSLSNSTSKSLRAPSNPSTSQLAPTTPSKRSSPSKPASKAAEFLDQAKALKARMSGNSQGSAHPPPLPPVNPGSQKVLPNEGSDSDLEIITATQPSSIAQRTSPSFANGFASQHSTVRSPSPPKKKKKRVFPWEKLEEEAAKKWKENH
ncbi:hypothetical protein JCM3765_005886 [Sporobolomyces pararoseus]